MFFKSEKYVEPKSGYDRLDSQISWYDRKSGRSQISYKVSRFAVISFSAMIPPLALAECTEVVAIFGVFIAVIEGLNHINQWHHNWITYRATCEALRHEKFTFLERANPYDIEDSAQARKLLVERVESLISTEHSKWIAAQEDAAKSKAPESPRPARSPN